MALNCRFGSPAFGTCKWSNVGGN